MRLGHIVAACAVLLCDGASARPFSVDDLLSAEEFGQLWVSPTGERILVERLIGQAAAAPFDQDVYSDQRRSRLYGASRPDEALRPLLPETNGGQTAGPLSPSGERLAVMRLLGETWELGVYEFATAKTHWLGLTPELNNLGQTIVWASDHRLLVATHGGGPAPLRLRTGGEMRKVRAELWAAAEAGAPALVRVGSGRFEGVRPLRPTGRLVEVDLRSGGQRELARADVMDMALSPSGQTVAALALEEPVQAPAQAALWVASPERRRSLLMIERPTGKVSRPCPTCHFEPNLLAWSPSEDRLLVYGRRDGPWTDEGFYFVADARGGDPLDVEPLTPVVERTSEGYAIPRAHWWSGAPLVMARTADGRTGWYNLAADGPRLLTAGLDQPASQLAKGEDGSLVALAAGAAWELSKHAAPRPLGPAEALMPPQALGLSFRERANGLAPEAWLIVSRPGRAERVRKADGSRRWAAPETGKVLRRSVSDAAAATVIRIPDGSLALTLSTGRSGPKTLMTLNTDFREIHFADLRLVQARAPDGRPLKHWLYLPPPSLKPPPLVVIPYPGASYESAPEPYGRGVGRFSANAELFAAAGFAVLVPSLPRSGVEPGAGLADQILAAVEAAAVVGAFDQERIALVGQSFGGYAALMAATQSTRFAAIVASAAPSNLTSMHGAMDPHPEVRPQDGLGLNANYGWFERGQGGLGARPWEDPDLYVRNSPVFQADQICAPVLLIHGDSDFVRLSQAQELFSALYRLGKDAELITAFGEGHVISSPGNRRAVTELTLTWLKEVLAEPASSERRSCAGP